MKHAILLLVTLVIVGNAGAVEKTSPSDTIGVNATNNSQAVVRKLSLYPEFGTGNVIMVHPSAKNASIIIKDNSGKVIKTFPLADNTNSTTINCKELTPGTYKATWKSGLNIKSATLVVEETES